MHRMHPHAHGHGSRRRRFLVLAYLTFLPATVAAQVLSVFTGVEPVRHLAESVGGDRVNVSVLVPPGQSPHTFEPSPRQLAGLQGADLYLSAGMPFEDAWVARLREALPGLELVHLLADAGGASHGHDHERTDPHPWTDPLAAIGLADTIRQVLAEADPDGATGYDARFRALRQAMEAAHREMTDILEPVRGRLFVVYHPAWGALAERFGLRQVAVESAGKSPGARHLTEVITEARRAGACAVFVQPQFSTRAAEQVARALDVPVVALDPLSGDLARHLPATARTLAHYLEQPCPR